MDTRSTEGYQASAHFRLRLLRDRLTRYAVAAGGNGVIVAILLIFIYLLYVVVPLVKRPEMHQVAHYPLVAQAPVDYLAMEEQAEIGMLVDQHGLVQFLSTSDGGLVKERQLPVPAGVTVDSFSAARPNSGVLALGLSNGQALVFKPTYSVTFPNDKRLITPDIVFPLGQPLVGVDSRGQSLQKVAVQANESYSLVGWTADGTLSLLAAKTAESLLEDEGSFEFTHGVTQTDEKVVRSLLIDPTQTHLYVIGEDGTLAWYDITSGAELQLHEQMSATPRGSRCLTPICSPAATPLWWLRTMGEINQWFSVRGDGGVRHLKLIRSFQAPENLTRLSPEFSRKGFLVGDDSGAVGVYHATAHHLLMREPVADAGIKQLAIAPRANALWALDGNNQFAFLAHRQRTPGGFVGVYSSKVWYSGSNKPAYIWQSSSADNEF